MAKKEDKLAKREERVGISPVEEMERRFEDFFRRPFSLLEPSGWLPRLRMPEAAGSLVDIFEERDDVVVKAELPGMKKDEIEVNITGDTITISGEKKKEEKVERKDYYRFERSYGSFLRSFTLPSGVDTGKAKAQFKDGVLELRVPKTGEAKKKEKKIKID